MKKTPNDYPQVKFRTGKDLEVQLASRSDEQTDREYSRVAKRDLDRYYSLLANAIPRFSEEEVLILVNVLNGAKYEPQMAHRLYVDVLEYLEESNEDYHSQAVSDDVRTLVLRVKAMSTIECMAIIDAAERFWQGTYHKEPEEVKRKLKEVGLIKKGE